MYYMDFAESSISFCCEHSLDEWAAEVDEGAGDAAYDEDTHGASLAFVFCRAYSANSDQKASRRLLTTAV